MWLKNKDYTVLVTPQGGSILGWWWRAYPILGPPQIKNINGKLKLRGETHWCYPNFGTGNPEVRPEHQQPKHGFLRNAVLEVAMRSIDAVLFEGPTAASGERLAIGIGMDSTRVRAVLCVANHGAESLPILPALHPYFSVPRGGLAVTMGGKVIAGVDGDGTLLGITAQARVVERTGPVSVELGRIGTVNLALSDDCTYVVLWSDLPSEYVCVEPVFGTPGSYGTEQGRWLKPGGAVECSVEFSLNPA